MLTATQKNQFMQDGFLAIENVISPDDCNALIARANELMNEFNPETTKTVFSAHDQRHAKHHYFLDSGDKIHFFFEEHAVNKDGELIKEKTLAINKIGHALHDCDPLFNHFSRQSAIVSLVNAIGISNPLLAQSMYICKQPHIGGEVTCHQDATYLYVENQPVLGLWFALEDATVNNGCLWGIPGAHKGPLKSRSIRDKDDHIHVERYDHTPWDLEKMVPLEVPRGSVILLHGLAPHMSHANTSGQSRHAYALHIISGDHHYPADNWLQRPKDNPFSGF